MIEDIVDRLGALIVSTRRECATILGVNGVDTAGKTTFAAGIERYLQATGQKTQLIHLDDFHNPRHIRSQGSDPIQSYLDHAFNLELLISEILSPARRGEEVDKEMFLLDLERDTFTNHRHYRITPDTIVILEGVLLYRQPLDFYFDIRIFLHIPFDEVLRRALKRDEIRFGPEFLQKYQTKYIPLQERYLKECRPIERSDMIIDNTDYFHPKLIS